MNRRTFFSLLASLPIVGGLFANKAHPEGDFFDYNLAAVSPVPDCNAMTCGFSPPFGNNFFEFADSPEFREGGYECSEFRGGIGDDRECRVTFHKDGQLAVGVILTFAYIQRPDDGAFRLELRGKMPKE